MDRLTCAAEFQRLASRFWMIHERQDMKDPEEHFGRACSDAGNALRVAIEHDLIDDFDGLRAMITEHFAEADKSNSPGELKDFACQSWFWTCILRIAKANTMNLKTLAGGEGFRVEISTMKDWRLHAQSFCSFCSQLHTKILASKRLRDFKQAAEMDLRHSSRNVSAYAVRAVDAWADLIEPDPTMRPEYYATKLAVFHEGMKLIRAEDTTILRELIVGSPPRSLSNYLDAFWDVLVYVLGDLEVWDNAKIDSQLMSRIMQALNDACRENGLNYQRNAVFAFVEEVERKLAESMAAGVNAHEQRDRDPVGLATLNAVVAGGLAGVLQAAVGSRSVDRVTAVIRERVANDLRLYSRKADDWAAELGVTKKTVTDSVGWKEIMKWRASNKANRVSKKTGK